MDIPPTIVSVPLTRFYSVDVDGESIKLWFPHLDGFWEAEPHVLSVEQAKMLNTSISDAIKKIQPLHPPKNIQEEYLRTSASVFKKEARKLNPNWDKIKFHARRLAMIATKMDEEE